MDRHYNEALSRKVSIPKNATRSADQARNPSPQQITFLHSLGVGPLQDLHIRGKRVELSALPRRFQILGPYPLIRTMRRNKCAPNFGKVCSWADTTFCSMIRFVFYPGLDTNKRHLR
jgi:hypothetical protein